MQIEAIPEITDVEFASSLDILVQPSKKGACSS